MVVEVAVAGGAVAALVFGYLIHRWRVLAFCLVAGLLGTAIDVSTRDLSGAGHDDQGLVAIVEAIMLTGALGMLALGIALRHWRDHHRGGPPPVNHLA